jgi:hypothetical protein
MNPISNLLVDKSLVDFIFVLVSVLFTADSRAELFHSFPSTPTLQKENQKLPTCIMYISNIHMLVAAEFGTRFQPYEGKTYTFHCESKHY